MATVQMPDGRVVEFPDSMSNADIEKVLKAQGGQAAAQPQPGVVSDLAAHFNQGLFGLAGLPGDISALYHKKMRNLLYGDNPPRDNGISSLNLPTSSQIFQHITDPIGWTNSQAQPSVDPGRRYADALAQGVGAVIPAIIAGPEAAGPSLFAGAGGGIGAQAGQDVFPGSTVAPLVGSLIGGNVGAGIASTAQRSVNALTGELSSTGQAYRAAEIPLRSPGLTSENPLTQTALAPAANLPLAESDLRTSLMSSADRLGVSSNMQEAGQYAQNAARDWVTTVMPKKEAAAWAPVDAKIPARTPTPLFGFAKALKDIQGDAGLAQPLRDAIIQPLPKRLQSVMNAVLDDPTGLKATPAQNGQPAIPAQPVTWSDVRSLRTALGDAMSNPSVVNDIGAQNLKHLYASITSDLSSTAKTQNALPEFAAANAESSRLHSFKDGTLSQIIKGKNPDPTDPQPEAAAAALLAPGKLKKGASSLEALNTELPDVTAELASAKLRSMAGMSDPATASETVAKGFVRDWAGLSPQAKNALILDVPTRNRLDAAFKVAQKVAGVKPAQATSSHGIQALAGLGLGGAASTVASHLLMGTPGNDLVPMALGEIGGAALPTAARAIRNRLSNSTVAALLASGRGPQYQFRGQVPALSLLAGEGFTPMTGEGQK